MKAFWAVFKIQLNANFGFSALRYRFRKEKDKIPQTLLVGAGVTLAVAMLIGVYSFLMGSVYAAGSAMGSPQIVLAAALLGLQLFLLVTGIFYVIGVFFYSRDLSALLPLPLAPWQVLGSKFAVVMAYEYLMAVPILAPPMLFYGIGQSMGAAYWLKSAVIIIASPAIPMLLASLVAIVLMRLLNIGKRRDLLAIVGGTLATVAILVINLLTQRFAQNDGAPDALTKLLADQALLANAVSSAFPPSAWATLALTETGPVSLLYMLLFLGVSALLAWAMLWLAGKVYYAAAMKSEETDRRGRRAGRVKAASAGPAGPLRAMVLREFKLLLRTPAYAMNCLVGSLIIPVIIPLSMIQGDETTSGLLDLIRSPRNSLAVTLGAAGVMLFASIINVTASTALSREGKTFWVSKMIPVTPRRQVYAKFLTAMAVASMGLALSVAMLLIFLKMDIGQCLLSLAMAFLGTVPVTAVNMLPDIIKPKLNWTNPYEAVKQNMNVLTSMLAACIVTGFLVLAAVLLAFLKLPDWAVYAGLAALTALLSAAALRVLAFASKRYGRLEA